MINAWFDEYAFMDAVMAHEGIDWNPVCDRCNGEGYIWAIDFTTWTAYWTCCTHCRGD